MAAPLRAFARAAVERPLPAARGNESVVKETFIASRPGS
jgi:hypothetical protein